MATQSNGALGLRVLYGGLALWLVTNCESPLGAPTGLPVEAGEPCGGDDTICMDWDSLLTCEDRTWQEGSCEDICAASGATPVGCIASELGDVCECSWPVCEPGASECVGPSELAECDGTGWSVAACDDVCAAQDPALPAAGCVASLAAAHCLCTREGTPCEPESESTCDSGTTLATCQAGTWEITACSGPCGVGEHPICRFSEGGSECGCG